MHAFKPFCFSLLSVSSLLAASSPPDSATLPDEKILSLDAFVVTSGPDLKTAFDLAQGASILAGDQLRLRTAATLGETLSATPGVNSTYYGPGSSRPLIRGLGGDRVRMLDNGVGSLDASNVSPDHNVSIEPLLVDRIEVLRGPATLQYGSSAVGGVVNVIDNRIPATAPVAAVSGRSELRFDTAAHERTGVAAITAGGPALAVQVNSLRTLTDDVSIPGFADPAHPANEGTLANSALATTSTSVGVATFGAAGNAGVAVSDYATRYGVPGGDPIAIDMDQRRLDGRAALTHAFGPFKSAEARVGVADYQHAEVDLATGRPNTTFRNRAYEGRLELAQSDWDGLGGTVGLQTSRSDFSAVGEEVVTPPSVTLNHALFAVESYTLNPALKFQFGGRYELQRIALGPVDPDLPAHPGYAAVSGAVRNTEAVSGSVGVVYYPTKDYSLGVSLARSERSPTAQELYSNGPHGGTHAYEIGTTGLGNESSLGLDVVARKRTGFVSGSLGGFLNRFENFVFQQRDGDSYFNETTRRFETYAADPGEGFLPVYQFVAREAVFYGAEAEVTLHLRERADSHVHLDLMGDYVHAQQTQDNIPLPRIQPARVGAALHFENARWNTSLEVRRVSAQTRVAPGETPTPGYTLVNANVSYVIPARVVNTELFLRASNLRNEEARVHSSFLKDVAPLPGRNLTAGVRFVF